MRHLIACMNPGIGAAGTYKIDGVVRDFCNSFSQLCLYGANPRFLELPTMKTAAIVFERQGNPSATDGIIRCEFLGVEKHV